LREGGGEISRWEKAESAAGERVIVAGRAESVEAKSMAVGKGVSDSEDALLRYIDEQIGEKRGVRMVSTSQRKQAN
jgi:hypothetical protein